MSINPLVDFLKRNWGIRQSFFLIQICLILSVLDQPRISKITEKLVTKSQIKTKIFTFETTKPEIMRTKAQLVPSGCLMEIKVNNSVYSYENQPLNQRCHIRRGFSIANILPADNIDKLTFDIVVSEDGPVFGVTVRSGFFTRTRVALFCMAFFVLMLLLQGWYTHHDFKFASIRPLLVIHGFVTYLLYTIFSHPPILHVYSDMFYHYETALKLQHASQTLWHMQKPLAYPFLIWISLAIFNSPILVSIVHSVSILLTFLLVWRCVKKLFNEEVADFSLMLLVGHLPLLLLSGYFLAESVFTFLLASLFYLIVHREKKLTFAQGFMVGAFVAFTGWFRGQALLLLPIYLVWMWFNNKGAKSKRWQFAVSAIAGFCLLAIFHYLMTYAIFKSPSFGPAAGGLNLVEGKCPEKANVDMYGSQWISPLFEYLGETQKKVWERPFSDDAFFWKEGLKCVGRYPSSLISSIRYDYYLFLGNPLWPYESNLLHPLSITYQIVFSLLILPFFFLSIITMFTKKRTKQIIPVLFLLSLFITSYLLKGELRYRIPFDIFIIPLAADGFYQVLSSKRNPNLVNGFQFLWFFFTFCLDWVVLMTF